MNTTAAPATIIVRRDFKGGTDYTYTAGWFTTRGDADAFVGRLTGGGTWIMEALPGLAAFMEDGAQIVVLAKGVAQ